MTTKLVYTGSVPLSFSSFPLSVQPGDEFYVPDDQLSAFIQRPDIALAPVEAAPEPEVEPESVSTDPDTTPIKSTKKAAQ